MKMTYKKIDSAPFILSQKDMDDVAKKIIAIQAMGIAFGTHNCQKAVLGISGGLDSTLALLVTVS